MRSNGWKAIANERKHVNQIIETENLSSAKRTEEEAARSRLRESFYRLCQETDRQKAGLALEGLLNGLFEIAGMNPRHPFRVTGEQIDGSFELDNEIYLLEAKWERSPVPESDLLVFRGKVEGKSQFTRGAFLSVNGFSAESKDAISRGKQPNFFLLDGYDLTVVLEGQIVGAGWSVAYAAAAGSFPLPSAGRRFATTSRPTAAARTWVFVSPCPYPRHLGPCTLGDPRVVVLCRGYSVWGMLLGPGTAGRGGERAGAEAKPAADRRPERSGGPGSRGSAP